MKTKRIVALICIVVFVFSSCLIFAIAKSVNTEISVETVEAHLGETVEVDVSIDNNPGVLGAVLTLSFDDGLTLINANSGDAFSSLNMTPPGEFSSPCNFVWDGAELNEDDIKNGTILTLTFRISDNASAGDIYSIVVSSEADEILNSDLNPVSVDFNSGKVIISSDDASEKPVIKVENTTSGAGSSVDINISVKNNPGILGAVLSISYDDGLTLKSASLGEAFSSLVMTPPGSLQSPCNFVWDGVELNSEDIRDGTILTLNFEIPSNAPIGKVYNISVSSNSGDIVDEAVNPVEATFEAGSITVESTDEHRYELIDAVEPDCENPGLYIYECIDCGDVYIEEPQTLGHIIVIDPAVAATCTENGLTEGSHCERCNKIIVAQKTIYATGHQYEFYRSTVTCTRDGNEIYKCSVCGKLNTVKTSAYGHNYQFSEYENDKLVYFCTECNTTNEKTPQEALVIWNAAFINTVPVRGNDSQFLDVNNDNFINAKDYAKILHISNYGR